MPERTQSDQKTCKIDYFFGELKQLNGSKFAYDYLEEGEFEFEVGFRLSKGKNGFVCVSFFQRS